MAVDLTLHDISSATATCWCMIEDVAPAGFAVEMFEANSAITQGSQTLTEVRLTLEGNMMAGYVPNLVQVTLNIEAGSPADTFFALLAQVERSTRKTKACSLTFNIPSIGRVIDFRAGVMIEYTNVNPVGRTVMSKQVVFTFSGDNIKDTMLSI